MDTISLSRTVFEIFDFKVFMVWSWSLTPIGHLGSKKIYTIRKSIYDFLYDFYGQHLSNSYRFRNIRLQSLQGFDLDLWPLKIIWGQKTFIPFESPYMTSYLTSMDNISLSRTVFEIFDFKVFRVWPWPLTPKGHLGSKKCMPFESSYMTSYLTSMDNISLSRTVFRDIRLQSF